jgi:hypothetical protein
VRPGDIDEAGVGTNDDDDELNCLVVCKVNGDDTLVVLMPSRRCLLAADCKESVPQLRAMYSLGSRTMTSSIRFAVDIVEVDSCHCGAAPHVYLFE